MPKSISNNYTNALIEALAASDQRADIVLRRIMAIFDKTIVKYSTIEKKLLCLKEALDQYTLLKTKSANSGTIMTEDLINAYKVAEEEVKGKLEYAKCIIETTGKKDISKPIALAEEINKLYHHPHRINPTISQETIIREIEAVTGYVEKLANLSSDNLAAASEVILKQAQELLEKIALKLKVEDPQSSSIWDTLRSFRSFIPQPSFFRLSGSRQERQQTNDSHETQIAISPG